ncbi:MAG TPA: hypothetical protein VG369_01550 [Humibacter sp.]|jgi:hypothetical protein|nr:hypothetical protein [Humibacter sp.]
MANTESHPDPDSLPDGSASENEHEDTASGGVSPDDDHEDDDPEGLMVNPDEVDREHDTDGSGMPIDNPSG